MIFKKGQFSESRCVCKICNSKLILLQSLTYMYNMTLNLNHLFLVFLLESCSLLKKNYEVTFLQTIIIKIKSVRSRWTNIPKTKGHYIRMSTNCKYFILENINEIINI